MGTYEPIAKDHIYKWVIGLVNEGYPRMVAKVPFLKEKGISVLDATAAFRGHGWHEVYVDDCCHYTDKGNSIVALSISAAVEGIASKHDRR